MKIGIFTDTFTPEVNGVAASVSNLVRGLQNEGHEVIVFAPGEENKKDEHYGARVYRFNAKNLWFYPEMLRVTVKGLPSIRKIMKKEEIDVFHSQDPFTLGLAAVYYAKKNKKPLVGTYHTLYTKYVGHLFKGSFNKLAEKIFSKPTRGYISFYYNRCSKVTAPSNKVMESLMESGIDDVEKIPNPIDLERLEERTSKDVREELSIPKDKKLILYLGRISYEKRLEVLLEAMKKIESERDDCFLLIGGKGPYLDKYKETCQELDIKNVKFGGYIEEELLGPLYREADIFVSPSDTETQGFTFFESMYCGTPVVGTDKQAAGEYINDEVNGLQFNTGDPNHLAEKVLRLIEDKELYRKIKRRGREYSKKFSIENATKEMIKVYEEAEPKNSFTEVKPKLKQQINKLKQSLERRQ